jgi:hypothetical protein
MTGRISTFLILLFAASAASGATITAGVDKQVVGLGDPVTLKITLSGKGGTLPEPTLPDLSAFDVYSSGRSQNISIASGAFSSTLDLTYILIPKKLGDLIIGPVVVRDAEGMASTEPIKIKVVQQSGINTPSPQAQQPGRRSQPPEKTGDFFIDQVVDKASPYAGEQVTLTFRFYQAINLWDQPKLEWPKYVGFTVEDLPPNSRYYETVRGRRYLVTEIKRALFPLSAGRITIDSPQLTIMPDDFGNAFDPFGFFDRDLRELFKRGQPKVLTANAIVLNVKPLPERGRPADFSGAVGKFSIKAQTDKDSVGVDEPITLKFVLSGTGNIKSISPVKLPELPDFRVYDSGNTESVSNANLLVSGTRTFEQAIIPKTSGTFEVPPVSFSYFDPSFGAYKTIGTPPLRIKASGEGLADVGGAPKNIISGKQSLGYIITDFPAVHKSVDLSRSFWFWLLQVLPLGAVVAALFYREHTKKLLADRGYARRFGAARRWRAIFKKAHEFMAKGDLAASYAALYDAVVGFVADRLNLEKSGLTIDELRGKTEIPESIRGDLISFLEHCQTARFSPGGLEKGTVDQTLARAEQVIVILEKAL